MANLTSISGTIQATSEGVTKAGDPKLGFKIVSSEAEIWVNAYPKFADEAFKEVLYSLQEGDWGMFHYTDDNFRSLKGIENLRKQSPEEKALQQEMRKNGECSYPDRYQYPKTPEEVAEIRRENAVSASAMILLAYALGKWNNLDEILQTFQVTVRTAFKAGEEMKND